MKIFLVISLATGAILDATATVLGISSILKAADLYAYVVSIVCALIILSFGLYTKKIISSDEGIARLLKLVWGFALFVDVYTSAVGNFAYIIFHKSYTEVREAGILSCLKMASGEQVFMVAFTTALFCLSPIILSYLRPDDV